jgi:capsular exopolysaccharide synthesis family protein
MSRIEEALRRSRTADAGQTHQRAISGDGGAQSAAASSAEAELEEAPWQFDATPAPARTGTHDAAPRLVPNRRQPAAPAHDDREAARVSKFGTGDNAGARFLGTRDMPPLAVEQYRRLAATLHHLQSERGIKVVMVTSALSGEGKSLTSTNLALTLSQSYRRRVILIDGDLRRPSIHQIFEVQNSQGLSEGIKSDSEEKLSITEIFENLSILTAGKPDPDPMSSLTSERMRRIVAEARMKFDWVIIDTPPVALLPDAGLLAAIAEAAVLVVGAARTPFDIIQRTVDTIGRDKIMGVVLNRAETTKFRGGKQYEAYYEADSYSH